MLHYIQIKKLTQQETHHTIYIIPKFTFRGRYCISNERCKNYVS